MQYVSLGSASHLKTYETKKNRADDTQASAASHDSPGSSTPTPPLPMARWATEELPRQHEILLRENGEFWEEIERLREENERLKGAAGAAPVAF